MTSGMGERGRGSEGPPGEGGLRPSYTRPPTTAVSRLPAPPRPSDGNTAKHLFELSAQVSTKSHSAGVRPSSSIAPARQNQLSISCWPDDSISASEVFRQVS